MDGLNLLNILKFVAVLVAAAIIGNWFLVEVKKAHTNLFMCRCHNHPIGINAAIDFMVNQSIDVADARFRFHEVRLSCRLL